MEVQKTSKTKTVTVTVKPKRKRKKKKKLTPGETEMLKKNLLERYLKALLNGDRVASRSVIEEALQCGVPANTVYSDIIWPIMTEIEKLEKADTITSVQEALATRINRSIVDQLQNKLPRKAQTDKKIVIFSTATEQGELGAQMITDLFESSGWQVRYVGSGVSRDDLVEFTNTYSPDVLLVYGMQADKAPQTRQLIDTIKTINACPDMKIMLSGGIFDRAEGLWEEIGADMYAPTAAQAVQIASADEADIPKPQRTINRRKKKNTLDKIAEALEPVLA
jgi:methanogenic corrinoid protein MtbC1